MDIDTWYLDFVGVQFAGADQLFYFCNGDITRFGHRGGEITGRFSEDQVAEFIAFPSLDDRKIGVERKLHKIGFAAEFPDLFAQGYLSTVTRGRTKSGYAHARHLDPGGEGALVDQVDFQFSRKKLALEFGVLTHIGAYHLSDLPRLQEKTQPKPIHPGIIGNAGEAANSATNQSVDAIFGYPATPESA